ncbi:MAG: Rho termination factor N-terminal domain-containing protein, partial [Nocardioides sp.]|nr:Rho termination factor N-terminal domain-containing protein [Nocardioides sp.]
MTETTDATTTASGDGGKKRGGGLSSMLIADLKSMAGSLGVAGGGSMKKAQLVDAIKAAQSGGGPASGRVAGRASASEKPAERPAETPAETRVTRRGPGKAVGTDQPARPEGDAGAQAPAAVTTPELPQADEQGDAPVVRTRTRSRATQKGGPEAPEPSSRQAGREPEAEHRQDASPSSDEASGRRDQPGRGTQGNQGNQG